MELKSIENKVKNEYPKINQIGEQKLKSSIPSKWKKIGLSSFVIGMIATNSAFASNRVSEIVTEIDGPNIDGGMTTIVEPVEKLTIIGEKIANCLIPITITGIIICIINIIYTKIKFKKASNENQENGKFTIKKSIKIILLISIILLLIGIMLKILFGIS